MVRLAAMLGVLLTALLGITPAQQPVFRAGTELATFGVTVTDGRGSFITDLTAEDFEILEDGVPQDVRYFARSDDTQVAPALHIGLLFDTSGSMGEDIRMARTAAIRFLNTLSDAVDITLVDFDTEVRMSKFGQQDFAFLVERIRGRKPDGFTAMYDALAVYLQSAELDNGRKILVLFSDGGDTRSTLSFTDAMTLVRASDATIYAIGFLQHQATAGRNQQRLRLSQIADESGGEAFFPLSLKQIDEAYEKILAQIRAQYTVGYVSTNTARDGRWRKVEIRLRRPDLEDAEIQARNGYFALYDDTQ